MRWAVADGESEECARKWFVPAAEELYWCVKGWKNANRAAETTIGRKRNRGRKTGQETVAEEKHKGAVEHADRAEVGLTKGYGEHEKSIGAEIRAREDEEETVLRGRDTKSHEGLTEEHKDSIAARVIRKHSPPPYAGEEESNDQASRSLHDSIEDVLSTDDRNERDTSRSETNLEPCVYPRKRKGFLFRSNGSSAKSAKTANSVGSSRFQKSRSVESMDKITTSPHAAPLRLPAIELHGRKKRRIDNKHPNRVDEGKALQDIDHRSDSGYVESNLDTEIGGLETHPLVNSMELDQNEAEDHVEEDALGEVYLKMELAPDNDVSGDYQPTKRPKKKVVQVVIPKTPRKPRQMSKRTAQQSHHFTTVTNSCIPVPPLYASSYGLIQEKYAHEPFHLLICVICLNKTINDRAVAAAEKIIVQYKTPEDLANANEHEMTKILQPTGFQNQRARDLIRFAKNWVDQPPVPDTYFRSRKIAWPGSNDAVNARFIDLFEQIPRPKQYDDCWEISHLHRCGRYAIDSWRIFCRDRLRRKAYDHLGTGWEAFHDIDNVERIKEEGGFMPEWKLVLPRDKELRAYLVWLWMREGIQWDPETGEKSKIPLDKIEAGLETVKSRDTRLKKKPDIMLSPVSTFSTIGEQIPFEDERIPQALKGVSEDDYGRDGPQSSCSIC